MRTKAQAQSTRKRVLTYSCLTALATVLAATAPPATAAGSSGTTSTGIETVTVTAEKRTTLLQKTRGVRH